MVWVPAIISVGFVHKINLPLTKASTLPLPMHKGYCSRNVNCKIIFPSSPRPTMKDILPNTLKAGCDYFRTTFHCSLPPHRDYHCAIAQTPTSYEFNWVVGFNWIYKATNSIKNINEVGRTQLPSLNMERRIIWVSRIH